MKKYLVIALVGVMAVSYLQHSKAVEVCESKGFVNCGEVLR